MVVPVPDWSRTLEIFLNQNKRMRFAWRAIDTNAIIKSNWEFSVRAFSIRLFGFMLCSSLLPPPPHDYGNTDIHEILCHWLWSLTLLFNLLVNLLRILSQITAFQRKECNRNFFQGNIRKKVYQIYQSHLIHEIKMFAVECIWYQNYYRLTERLGSSVFAINSYKNHQLFDFEQSK